MVLAMPGSWIQFVLGSSIQKCMRKSGLFCAQSLASRKYIHYHQEKFGFLLRMTMDIIVSNCVICLCPDKKTVVREAYKVLKEGDELYFSDMYASNVVPLKRRSSYVGCGNERFPLLVIPHLIGLGGGLQHSSPHLSQSHRGPQLRAQKKAGDISYASGTYRLFKLPKKLEMSSAIVTYKGTVSDYPCQL
ncbi:arsenite methyltransferase [Oncorhynchus mykiss]|uniref:arsenite methyltransferase n=1 Tax=Oncorhynchus mykiss TaxID=8022 RepID=UPI001878AD1A|nr:arsenite methyltransferase [Oncorhynchus mykiss]XP_036817900.1 arsenite methyltransferase [Oncorhynchus mykiss]